MSLPLPTLRPTEPARAKPPEPIQFLDARIVALLRDGRLRTPAQVAAALRVTPIAVGEALVRLAGQRRILKAGYAVPQGGEPPQLRRAVAYSVGPGEVTPDADFLPPLTGAVAGKHRQSAGPSPCTLHFALGQREGVTMATGGSAAPGCAREAPSRQGRRASSSTG